MSVFKSLGALCVGAFLLCGCATTPSAVIETKYYLGNTITVNTVKIDTSTRTIYRKPDDEVSVPWLGLEKVILFGWDITGLDTTSPWFGCRFAYLLDAGLDAGFDRNNFTVGLDYNYSGIIIGGQLEQPYFGGSVGLGGKIALVL